MSDEKLLAESDNPKNVIIVAAVVAGVIGLIAVVIGVNEFYKFAVRDAISEKQLAPESTLKRKLKAEELAHLTKYQWVDKNAGVVRIPVERALELTARDWAARPDGVSPAAPAPAAPAPEKSAPEAPKAPPTTKGGQQ